MSEFIIHINSAGSVINKNKLTSELMNLEAGTYSVKITSLKKRSHPQNRWLHAILPDIDRGLRGAGYSEVKNPEDAKAVIKQLFFKKKISNGVEEIEIIEGTSEQTKEQFALKADEIIRWAAEYLGIDIAPPEKQLEIL
jgi:hypothetical protein